MRAQVSVCGEVRVVRRARAGCARVPAAVPVGVGQGRNGAAWVGFGGVGVCRADRFAILTTKLVVFVQMTVKPRGC
jgi:hypothetical protein